MLQRYSRMAALSAALACSILGPASGQVVLSGAGAAATTARDAFRTAIGGVDNGPGGGPQTGGRREINWDAVKLDGTDFGGNTTVIDLGNTVGIPVNRFQARGAQFAEVYAVSGDGFAGVNPGSAGQFPAFSPKNTFVMFDENAGQFDDRLIEMNFTFAGTPNLAGTRGFGAIFLDVEQPDTSSIEYFGRDSNNNRVSLGKYFVPVGGDAETEFLGVLFDQPIVTDVTLTVGTHALFNFDGSSIGSFGPEDLAHGVDLAATDDFLYAEPTRFQAVPEPSSLALLAGGALAFVLTGRRRHRR